MLLVVLFGHFPRIQTLHDRRGYPTVNALPLVASRMDMTGLPHNDLCMIVVECLQLSPSTVGHTNDSLTLETKQYSSKALTAAWQKYRLENMTVGLPSCLFLIFV